MMFRVTVSLLAMLCLGVGVKTHAAPTIPAYVTAAVTDPNRPESDTQRDTNRKPAAVVAFAGIKPGDKIVDMDPGALYFTRIFSTIVGPNGRVHSYLPSDPDEILRKNNIPINIPKPDPHYSNVSFIHAPVAELRVPERVDAVWTSDNYHDFHNKVFGPADIATMNKAIYDRLKPGGIFIVIDHAAEDGSGLRDTETLHRIDPAQVKKEVLAAGFVFAGASTILANSAGDHTKKVFDSTIRGKTDQFVFKFKKP